MIESPLLAIYISFMPNHKRDALKFLPVTPSRWKDFEKLFGERGACGGCWCTFWRQSQKEFDTNRGTKNKRKIKKIIESGKPPGIIGYTGKEPVAWCCVGAREDFSRLERSHTFKPIDDQLVWTIPCLFVAKSFRKDGVSSLAIDAAVKFAFKKGAKTVESYPNDTGKKKWADPYVYMGLVSSFEKAGFKVVRRPSRTRAIMRRYK